MKVPQEKEKKTATEIERVRKYVNEKFVMNAVIGLTLAYVDT